MKITENKVVELEYVLRVGGEIVDESEPGEPLVYLHGHSNIIPGLERALEGKQVGDSLQVTVPPEEGYGERDEENVQVLPREDFEDDVEVGASYYAQSEDGSITPLTVIEVLPEGVRVDFNPPLAGETLDFQVSVKGIRDATSEELEHGHVHGGDLDEEE
ncbi:FKBP-type peptidyl-prolyl cis-trans isomerase [Deinococcus peraridilitoris]|uniref:Peptidyl-prolyl cis-trans isomerase n=1 Tax=Deinococcus peraridilitoris (strain DSM 19664 / LMG 22246 / CIP 109416 / KR-200) TaxID=937777 RepID=L0A2Y7_DEIPD|nr:peptidylprolyl isomerase [Deinococcus peraridilitoris]AFZ67375.1 FKBP-type peptidyl-prolyl cis-trans isomerase [Deinococcus peraridilitoris DSM 19664]